MTTPRYTATIASGDAVVTVQHFDGTVAATITDPFGPAAVFLTAAEARAVAAALVAFAAALEDQS